MELFKIFVLVTIIGWRVGCWELKSTTVHNFLIQSISFWNLTKPIVFLSDVFNTRVFVNHLWRRLSDLRIPSLIYKIFDVDDIRQLMTANSLPTKLIVIGDKNVVWESFREILQLKILKYRITVIFLCLDCQGPMFGYYHSRDVLGLIILAYPHHDNTIMLYNLYYSYHIRGLNFHPVGNWNSLTGFQVDISISSSVACFRNATLRILTSHIMPYLYEYEDPTGAALPSGFCGEVLKLLTQMYHFNVNVSQSVHKSSYGLINRNGSFNGVIGEFLERNLDLAIGVFSRSISRESRLDYTTPITTGSNVIAAHLQSKHGGRPWSFKPVSLWLAILLSIVITTSFNVVIVRRELERNATIDWMSITMATWFLQGGVGGPKCLSSRIIYITSCLLFWLLICFFNGTLVSYLTSDSKVTFTTLDQLVHSDYTIGTTEGSTSLEWLQTSKEPKLLALRNRAVMRATIDLGAASVCYQPHYAHLSGLATIYNILKEGNDSCQYYFIKEIVGKDPYHFVTQNDDVLSRRLSRGITRLRTSGLLARLEKRFSLGKINIISTSETANNYQVQMAHLVIPFAFIIGGNCVAILAMMCEVVIYGRGRKSDKSNINQRIYIISRNKSKRGRKLKRPIMKKTLFFSVQ